MIPSISSFRKENIPNNINNNNNINDSSITTTSSSSSSTISEKHANSSISSTTTSGSNARMALQGLRLRLDLAKNSTPLSSSTKQQQQQQVVVTSSSNSRDQYRLLRSGETLDSLFCLSEETSDRHRALCYEIAHGNKADDGMAWLDALSEACTRAAVASPISKFDLIRLHKRACVKLHITVHSSSEKLDNNDLLRVKILLSYAQAHVILNQLEEAHKKYQDILLFGIASQEAFVHVQIAKFYEIDTNNKKEAIDTLQLGLQKNAQPKHLIQQQLDRLLQQPPPPQKRSITTTTTTTPSNVLIPPLLRSTTPYKITASTYATPSTPLWSSSSLSSSSRLLHNNIRTTTTTTPARNQIIVTASEDNKSTLKEEQHVVIANTAAPSSQQQQQQTNNVKKTVMFAESCTKLPSSFAPPLLSLLRRTPSTRKRNIGGALRVNNNANSSDNSYSSDEGVQQQQQQQDKNCSSSNSTNSSTSPDDNDGTKRKITQQPKITKSELSYMLNWDPETYRKDRSSKLDVSMTTTTSTDLPATASSKEQQPYITEKRKGTCEVQQQQQQHKGGEIMFEKNHVPDCKTNNNNKNNVAQIIMPTEKQTTGAEEEEEEPLECDTNNKNNTNNNSATTKKQLNPDFVNLASEENIIKVNSSFYAKLGVIGQGGSCKVYRALSSTLQVLAIKKVKLEVQGKIIDSRTIEMYKNEIALLQKLAGNPCIIQMFDSEVDLKRKAIFLVMEVGEVDLAYVLQQQAKLLDRNKSHHRSSHTTSSRPSLNMNFIRLTWQQMLSAVCSIHAEPHCIVHGDLKPANFLFVKGALKLIDFGIAKAILKEDNTTNIYRDSQIGTLNYMSPEAIMGTSDGEGGSKMKLGRASDIWSLGCILYQMVYGQTPFAELHMLQKLHAITDPSHKIKYPEADEAAVDAMQLCLRRKAEERPPIVGTNGLLNEHWFLHSRRLVASDEK